MLVPSLGLWCCEEHGFSALSPPLILSKVETREREAFPFPVSFSAMEVVDGGSIQPLAVYAKKAGLGPGSPLCW